jgi:hypothetical protein
MYSASTHQMLRAMSFDFLWFLPRTFFWISLIAWLATFLGLAHQLAGRIAARCAHWG